jgi:hypothetical protein
MVSPNDRLRLPPPWISPAAGMPDREVRPVIIVQRRRLLYPAYVQDYLDRVTAADVAAGNTSGLELGVTDGANTFIQDLVSDTYLGVSGGVISQAASVIKASVPMAGARTRLGAMTPLVGPAPTSFNFGNNDYNRKTGLVGDGSTKYLNSNRNNNADPQNSNHICCLCCRSINSYIGAFVLALTLRASAVPSWVDIGGNGLYPLCINKWRNNLLRYLAQPVLFTHQRSAAANFTHANQYNYRHSKPRLWNPFQRQYLCFAAKRGTVETNARLAFYSIGESLDLAILDARVTALINAYAAAIP